MLFDVTDLDKEILIKGLIANAKAVGIGEMEYKFKNFKGELVDSITEEEISEYLIIIDELKNKNIKGAQIIDYYKGQPIKLELFFRKERLLASSHGYDVRNGKYSFLKTLIDFFGIDDILIVQKGYGRFSDFNFANVNIKLESALFDLIKTSNTVTLHGRKYWKIPSLGNYQDILSSELV